MRIPNLRYQVRCRHRIMDRVYFSMDTPPTIVSGQKEKGSFDIQ